MNYTLEIINSRGKKRKSPRTLQNISLATAPDGELCAIADEIIKAVIQHPVITFMRDGILIDGYENGSAKGHYYKQRWWLRERECKDAH